MGIRTLTYLDLPLDQRKNAAKVARDRLRAMVSNPLLTTEQSQILAERMTLLDQWEMGSLSVSLVDPMSRAIPETASEPTPEEQVTEPQGGPNEDA